MRRSKTCKRYNIDGSQCRNKTLNTDLDCGRHLPLPTVAANIPQLPATVLEKSDTDHSTKYSPTKDNKSQSPWLKAAQTQEAAITKLSELADAAESIEDDDVQLFALASDLRILSSLIEGHAQTIRYPALASARAATTKPRERPTVKVVERHLQHRFGDATELLTHKYSYPCPVLGSKQWVWAYQILLPDGRVICESYDPFEPRWGMLEHVVLPWSEASSEAVDAKTMDVNSTAHHDFIWETRTIGEAPKFRG